MPFFNFKMEKCTLVDGADGRSSGSKHFYVQMGLVLNTETNKNLEISNEEKVQHHHDHDNNNTITIFIKTSSKHVGASSCRNYRLTILNCLVTPENYECSTFVHNNFYSFNNNVKMKENLILFQQIHHSLEIDSIPILIELYIA